MLVMHKLKLHKLFNAEQETMANKIKCYIGLQSLTRRLSLISPNACAFKSTYREISYFPTWLPETVVCI